MLKVGSLCFCSGFELLPVVCDLILSTSEDMMYSWIEREVVVVDVRGG